MPGMTCFAQRGKGSNERMGWFNDRRRVYPGFEKGKHLAEVGFQRMQSFILCKNIDKGTVRGTRRG
jgi:hypothetical protein